ncbi:MAG: 2-hydroxychromene-2-carboxylate isomerase [Caulobacteraceae bacterium]
MSQSPRFLFDFGSPNAYLAHRVIPAIEERAGVRFAYEPVLLGGIFKATGNRSPMESYAGVKGKLAYEALETRRFIARHGLDRFRPNPHFPVNTLLIMRGAVAARRIGTFEAYVELMFTAMWEDGRKMDDPAVVAEALTQLGAEGGEILTLTSDPAVKAELITATNSAVTRGVFGLPTLFVGEEMWFGKDRLDEVERAAVDASSA